MGYWDPLLPVATRTADIGGATSNPDGQVVPIASTNHPLIAAPISPPFALTEPRSLLLDIARRERPRGYTVTTTPGKSTRGVIDMGYGRALDSQTC